MANLIYNGRQVKINRFKTYGDLREACVKAFLSEWVQSSHFYIFEGKIVRKPSDILKSTYVEIVLADGVHRHTFIYQVVLKSLRFQTSLRRKGIPILERLFLTSSKGRVNPEGLFQDDLQNA